MSEEKGSQKIREQRKYWLALESSRLFSCSFSLARDSSQKT